MQSWTRRRTGAWRSTTALLAAMGLLFAVSACSSDPSNGDAPSEPDASETTTEDPAADQDADRDDGPVDDASQAPSSTASGTAPRADVALFPDAELVHEQVLAAAVEEVWVVDAPLDDVLEFYAAMPGLDGLPGSSMTRDDGGGYLELDLFQLVRDGETDRAVYEAAVADAEYGPLLRIAVVTSESQILVWFGGSDAQAVIPPGSTVILLSVLTG